MVTYSSTYTAAEMIDRWHGLDQFRLDIAGMAQAFAWTFGHGDWTYPVEGIARAHDPIAYDSESGVWREFIASNGWSVKGSILPEMSDIVSALCSMEAHKLAWAAADKAGGKDDDFDVKLNKEYDKLRRKNLGTNVDKAVKQAEAVCAIEKWNVDDDRIGLPDGECLHVTPMNLNSAVRREIEGAEYYLTRHLAGMPGLESPLWLQFVLDLTDGDQEMADALQVWTAASLLKGNPDSLVKSLCRSN